MRRIPVKSKSVASVGYDSRARVLEVEYHGGKVYDYLKVPPLIYDELMAAESKGRFVNYVVKQLYDYRPVSRDSA